MLRMAWAAPRGRIRWDRLPRGTERAAPGGSGSCRGAGQHIYRDATDNVSSRVHFCRPPLDLANLLFTELLKRKRQKVTEGSLYSS